MDFSVDPFLLRPIFHPSLEGALAQLVERLHGMQEVRSSTLLCSTSLRQGFGWQAAQLGLTDKVDEERFFKKTHTGASWLEGVVG